MIGEVDNGRPAQIHTVRRRRTLEARLHQSANEARARHGLGELRWDPTLAAAAAAHATDLLATRRLSHTGHDGSNVLQRVRRESRDWTGAGENLAIGQRTPEEVIEGWLGSPGHRANLLHASFTHAGSASFRPPPSSPFAGGHLWVQVYGARSSYLPVVVVPSLTKYVRRLCRRLQRDAALVRVMLRPAA